MSAFAAGALPRDVIIFEKMKFFHASIVMVGTEGVEPSFVRRPLFYRQSEQPVARVPNTGGESGIPTRGAGHDPDASVFKTAALAHSAISPKLTITRDMFPIHRVKVDNVAEGRRFELHTFRCPWISRPVAAHAAVPSMAENYGVEPYTFRCSLISNQAPDHSGIAFHKICGGETGT